MTRVTADTNIYVSALLFGGLPGSFLDLALLRAFTLVTSPVLLDELTEILLGKFAVAREDARAVRAKLEAVAVRVVPTKIIVAVREDPDDNRVLECAVEGHAHYIVTGDRHLLKLASYEAIPIVTVRQFLDFIAAEKP